MKYNAEGIPESARGKNSGLGVSGRVKSHHGQGKFKTAIQYAKTRTALKKGPIFDNYI